MGDVTLLIAQEADRLCAERDEAFKLLERLSDVLADRHATIGRVDGVARQISDDFRTLKANREGQTPTDVVS